MIFLDTGNILDITRFHKMGIIRGVTTNPTILVNEKLFTMDDSIKTIAKHVWPLPVSVEVTKTDYQETILQAKHFSNLMSINSNIVVKIPFHGPNGELKNLEIIHELEATYHIKVNVTAMMSAQQCLLASYAGATYVSIFGGRVNNMGYNVCQEIEKLRKALDSEKLKSQIIVGSVREPLNVIEWLNAGAHIVTVPPKILETMMVHPYTKETVQMFLKDAEKLKEN